MHVATTVPTAPPKTRGTSLSSLMPMQSRAAGMRTARIEITRITTGVQDFKGTTPPFSYKVSLCLYVIYPQAVNMWIGCEFKKIRLTARPAGEGGGLYFGSRVCDLRCSEGRNKGYAPDSQELRRREPPFFHYPGA